MFQTSALEILYGGQFTLSTQLIKSLPPLFKSELVLRGVIFLKVKEIQRRAQFCVNISMYFINEIIQ